MKRTTIFLPAEQTDWLESEATRTGAKPAEIIRRAIQAQIAPTDPSIWMGLGLDAHLAATVERVSKRLGVTPAQGLRIAIQIFTDIHGGVRPMEGLVDFVIAGELPGAQNEIDRNSLRMNKDKTEDPK
jgi:hypothetical protein